MQWLRALCCTAPSLAYASPQGGAAQGGATPCVLLRAKEYSKVDAALTLPLTPTLTPNPIPTPTPTSNPSPSPNPNPDPYP